MYQYTHKNHFIFGYLNQEPFTARVLPNNKFYAKYGSISSIPDSWKAANEKAAKLIYENRCGDIWLLLSGGMDSEVCLLSFINQKLPVKTISLKLKNYENKIESLHLSRIISEYSLNHNYIEIDPFKLIDDINYKRIVADIGCVSPIIASHLWLADQVDGTPVIGQGDVHLKKDVPLDYIPGTSPYLPSNWYLVECEKYCLMYLYFKKKKKPAIPGFFQYLPEQTYAYLNKNIFLKQLVENKIHGKLGTRSSKNKMIKLFYPDLPDRIKQHGWEELQGYHDLIRERFGSMYTDNNQDFKIYIDDLNRMLSLTANSF